MAPARSARRQPGDVGAPRLDGDRGPVGGRPGMVCGGDDRAGLRPGRARPSAAAPAARGASQRPIAPVPPPRSWITQRPAAGPRRARCSTRSAARAAASAGSRRASQPAADPVPGALTAPPQPARRRGSTRSVDHPNSDSRRSRAAWRNRALSSASPSQARSAAASAAGSPGGTSNPGRIPPAPWPRASVTPPTSVATTGRPRARASVIDHAVRLGPGRQHHQVRVARSCGRDRPRSEARRSPRGRPARRSERGDGGSSTNAGSRSRLPTHTQCQDSSEIIVQARRAARRGPCRISRRRRRAVRRRYAVPLASSAASTPGSATWTRSAGNEYSSSSRRRVHALVVTTATAADSTARSRIRASTVASAAGRWPSGMCTSKTKRNRRACGTSTSGAVEAIDPSSSTTPPSGIRLRRRRGRSTTPRRAAASRRVWRARAPTSRSS